jgi:hypothetical protein
MPTALASQAEPTTHLATAPVTDPHQASASDRLNALAHKALAAALKVNSLAGSELKPWHLKVDYQARQFNSPKPVNGSFEEWHQSQYQWRRTFAGSDPSMDGTNWSVSRFEHYKTKARGDGMPYDMLNMRVAGPVVEPLYLAANIKPDYQMEIKRVSTAGIALNCVSVVNPFQYAQFTSPDTISSTLCFDADLHLRLITAGNTQVMFDDIQLFQGRAVPHDVKVIVDGKLDAEMKIVVLEALPTIDAEVLKPAKSAISSPYTVEPGLAQPESIFETAAKVPLQPDGFPFRGYFPMPILIHRDGTVKARPEEAMIWNQSLKDALADAINKWKYKPYLVDGLPVEVEITVPYVLDGKPFVPSYERFKVGPPAPAAP